MMEDFVNFVVLFVVWGFLLFIPIWYFYIEKQNLTIYYILFFIQIVLFFLYYDAIFDPTGSRGVDEDGYQGAGGEIFSVLIEAIFTLVMVFVFVMHYWIMNMSKDSEKINNLSDNRNLKVIYNYDYRLEINDSKNQNRESFKTLNSIDSIIELKSDFGISKGEKNILNILILREFNDDDVRIINNNETIFNKKLTTLKFHTVTGFLSIDKLKSEDIDVIINEEKTANIKLDFRFDYCYLWFDKDCIDIVLTNYPRLYD